MCRNVTGQRPQLIGGQGLTRVHAPPHVGDQWKCAFTQTPAR